MNTRPFAEQASTIASATLTDAEDAQRLLAAVVQSCDDAILTKTLGGKILSWNPAAERLFGYTSEEAIGQSILMLIPVERHGEEHMIIERLRKGERIEHYETVRMAKDGRPVDISLSISPLHDKHGTIIGASKIARDITEQKRLQEALREADRRKDEFLATLAHELRNPLAPIKNALYLLEEPKATPEVKQQARDMMKRQVHQMQRLIDDLMDIARINQGKIKLQQQQITLADVVQAAVEIAKPLITEKHHELVVTLPPDTIWLNADMVRLSQVFANLLTNAAKYTDAGGRITLSAREANDEVAVSVGDSGIGIPQDMLASIFDLFVQVDSTIERAQGGLGIGLTLVRELVRLHSGRIEVLSEGAGMGSEFTVHLPRIRTVTSAKKNAAFTETLNPYRVLVVDDNRASATTLGWMLEAFGHEVALAYNLQTAMDKAKEFHPQVILLDIGIPGTNGYDICKIMRQDPATKDAFIVAQTGWGQEEHRQRSKEAGFNHHLVKPIELDTLKDLLEGLKTPA